MTTADVPRRASRRARFPTAPASFDLPCAADEALRRLRGVVRRSALVKTGKAGLVGRVSPDGVRVRWSPGGRELFPVVFDGRFSEQASGPVLEGHYRHATSTKMLCNLVLGLCVVLVVFGIMGMTLLWTIGVGPGAERWVASAILGALAGIGALALLKGRVPLRPAECDELGAAIRSALGVAPAR